MKKLLLVLMVVALASFLFVGCLAPVPPVPDEDEDEDGVVTEVTVDIEDSVVIDGKTYVSGGSHTITVTFPAPVVGGVEAYITGCTGDYRPNGGSVVLFPDADKKVWTGSGDFGYYTGCCASYVEVVSGECVEEVCIKFPVIVDSCYPFAEIEITVDNCICEGCEITFASGEVPYVCDPDVECCDDTCSGIASWSMVLYDGYPFDKCCDPSVCEEPIGSCSGTDCPFLCTTDCLTVETTYWAVITLVDNVGLKITYIAEIELTGGDSPEDTCEIVVTEYKPAPYPDCIVFVDTGPVIGTCVEECMAKVVTAE